MGQGIWYFPGPGFRQIVTGMLSFTLSRNVRCTVIAQDYLLYRHFQQFSLL